MKTKDIDCPACKARPGEPCIDVGYGDQRRNPSGFHVGRAKRARMITGVEAREVNAKRRKFSVKDFGAVGDAKTDDSKAIQAAVDAASGKEPGQ